MSFPVGVNAATAGSGSAFLIFFFAIALHVLLGRTAGSTARDVENSPGWGRYRYTLPPVGESGSVECETGE